jgi:hypothetical protein
MLGERREKEARQRQGNTSEMNKFTRSRGNFSLTILLLLQANEPPSVRKRRYSPGIYQASKDNKEDGARSEEAYIMITIRNKRKGTRRQRHTRGTRWTKKADIMDNLDQSDKWVTWNLQTSGPSL